MNKLYVVKDGIANVGIVNKINGERLRNTNYYLLSYDLKSNVGYIKMKCINQWRLYTSIGSNKDFKSRYHQCVSFDECIVVLRSLFNIEAEIIICEENNIKKSLCTTDLHHLQELKKG